MVCLAAVGTVARASAQALLNSLAGALASNSRGGSVQTAYCDFLALTLCEALLWTSADKPLVIAFEPVRAVLDSYVTSTRAGLQFELFNVYPDRPSCETDLLEALCAALREGGLVNQQRVISQPHLSFPGLTEQKSHALTTLPPAPARSPVNSPYALRPLLWLFKGTSQDVAVSALERVLLSQCFADIMTSLQWVRKEEVKHLLKINVPFDSLPVLLETLFAMLFCLRTSGLAERTHVAALVSDLVVAEPKLGQLLGHCLKVLVSQLSELELECRERFARWFAVHLSNHAFDFPWKLWRSVIDADPLDAKRLFVSTALQSCCRMSTWELMKRHKDLPESLHGLLPPQPKEKHKFSLKRSSPEAQAALAARSGENTQGFADIKESRARVMLERSDRLMGELRDKTDDDTILAWLDETFGSDRTSKVELMVDISFFCR